MESYPRLAGGFGLFYSRQLDDCPAGGTESTGTTAGKGGGEVQAAGPVCNGIVLVLSKFRIAVQNDRCPFRCISILMGIGGNGCDTRKAKIKCVYRISQLFSKGQYKPT